MAMLEAFEKGQRIRLLKMEDDPCPIPVGATGTITDVGKLWDDMIQCHVAWDAPNDHRTLAVIIPQDSIEVIR
jgi:hypothetical protein